MSPKEMTSIRIDADVLEAMRHVKDIRGVPMAKQVDFAMRAWLAKEGFSVKAPSRRVHARRKG